MSILTSLLACCKNKSLLVDIVFLIHSTILFISAFSNGFVSFLQKVCATLLAFVTSFFATAYLLKLISLNSLFIVTSNSFFIVGTFVFLISFSIFSHILPIYKKRILIIDLVYASCYMILVNFVFLSAINSALKYICNNQDKPWAVQIMSWDIIPKHILPDTNENGEIIYSQTKSLFVISLIFVDAVQDKVWKFVMHSRYSSTLAEQTNIILKKYHVLSQKDDTKLK